MTDIEMLPCPFCGGAPELAIKGNVHSTRKCVVRCTECRYQRVDAALRYGDDWLRSTAAAAWNRRVAKQPAAVDGAHCGWKLESDLDTEAWASVCGELWSFVDGGPEENKVRFCHGCGLPVALSGQQKERDR